MSGHPECWKYWKIFGRSGLHTEPHWGAHSAPPPRPVMWSETDGRRTRPVWDQKNRSWSWSCTFCVVLWNTILSRSSSSWRTQQLFKYYLYFQYRDILCLEHHYCGDQQWRSVTYLQVKSAKCLCLLPVVLVLILLHRSWSCKKRSWSCYFGLGLKNLVLFTSLPDSLAGEAWCPVPKNPTPLSAFGLDFRPFGPHSAAFPNSLHFPQCIGVLIKTLVMPIFGAK